MRPKQGRRWLPPGRETPKQGRPRLPPGRETASDAPFSFPSAPPRGGRGGGGRLPPRLLPGISSSSSCRLLAHHGEMGRRAGNGRRAISSAPAFGCCPASVSGAGLQPGRCVFHLLGAGGGVRGLSAQPRWRGAGAGGGSLRPLGGAGASPRTGAGGSVRRKPWVGRWTERGAAALPPGVAARKGDFLVLGAPGRFLTLILR